MLQSGVCAPPQIVRYLLRRGNIQGILTGYRPCPRSVNAIARPLTPLHYLLGILLVATVGLLAWHRYGMERVVELVGWKRARLEVLDDRFMGGTSKVSLERRGDALTMRCRLTHTIQWPSCKYMFYLSDTARGLDLSGFDTVTFDIRYKGPGPHTVRSLLLNYEPAISKLDDPMSQKINEVEFEVPESGRMRVPLNVYHTATWWIGYMKIPLAETDMRIDNVTRVELLTGSTNAAGEHEIELRSIRFHGKWIRSEHLYIGLMAAWIVCAVSWPLLSAVQLRRQLRHSSQRLALLSEINHALQLEARELVEQANTDALTGALNRQGLRGVLLSTSSLLASPMAVLFVDIDHFKRINDRHGHDIGDEVLRTFANTVHGGIRSNDKLVRWGGEEFLIVCPATTADQARQLAEKLRTALHAQAWPAGLDVTASFGVAAREREEDIGTVIKRADSALYDAKAAGRDCVVVADVDALPLLDNRWVAQSGGPAYD